MDLPRTDRWRKYGAENNAPTKGSVPACNCTKKLSAGTPWFAVKKVKKGLRSWLKEVISEGATKERTVQVSTVPRKRFHITPLTL